MSNASYMRHSKNRPLKAEDEAPSWQLLFRAEFVHVISPYTSAHFGELPCNLQLSRFILRVELPSYLVMPTLQSTSPYSRLLSNSCAEFVENRAGLAVVRSVTTGSDELRVQEPVYSKEQDRFVKPDQVIEHVDI